MRLDACLSLDAPDLIKEDFAGSETFLSVQLPRLDLTTSLKLSNLCIITNKYPTIPQKTTKPSFLRRYSSIQRHYSRVIDDYSSMDQHILRYGSEHPRLWVRASSAMGRSILDYGSEHPRLWVRASSTMGRSILDYGSEHPRLWVRASSTMGRSILDYGSEHPRLWVGASSTMGQHMVLYGSVHGSLWVST